MDLTPFNYDKRRDAAILIGAGATRGADFVTSSTICKPPLDADFFVTLRSSGLISDGDTRKLLEFVEREFGSLQVRMETFYSQALLHDQFVADIHTGRGRRRDYSWSLRYFRRVLPKLFALSVGENRCRYHASLARAVGPGDTIISFNYDCLVDRALAEHAGNRWNPETGYGFAVVGSNVNRWRTRARGRPFVNTIRLLKPHGSFNWRRGKDGRMTLRRGEYAERDEDHLVIVPPLWQKSFDEDPYHQIWREMRRRLSAVKALFVVGYSLPETDVYTQATLRMDVSQLDFLCVVNPDVDARKRIRRTLRSAISTTTHVVELEYFREMADVLD